MISDGCRFTFFVNENSYESHDAELSGRDILRVARFNPASEHVLIQLLQPGSRTVGLDELVDLRAAGREAFRAFGADRAFTFTVDEIGYEWGAASISEADLRDIAQIPPGKVLVLERQDGPPVEIEEGGALDLSAKGAEHLKSRKGEIVVTYGDDEKEFRFEPGEYTGAQLATRFAVPSGYELDLVVNGEFRPIPAEKSLRLKNGMHFISQPGTGSSS